VPLIDVGDLIVAKVLAGRPKDVTDAGVLWRLHGHRLDEARLREMLRQLEIALGQSDLVSLFDKLVGQVSPDD